MNIFIFLTLASLFAGGIYLILSMRYSDILIGIAIVFNGVNLLLLESSHPLSGKIDPLPQALILTTIVVGFALISLLSAISLKQFRGRTSDEIPPVKWEDEA
ncbi:NADH-quinone oxidoreductase subunit K [Simkania negevensis]|uniref:NADH-quinone oxidoreductase subunit K n=1 Tax=Simkania negevensis TaxID=83561 RepID=A0ABS3APR8_9BACT|nr:NADH-quinone oxidoreductase subunit K [Simkania negevensis]